MKRNKQGIALKLLDRAHLLFVVAGIALPLTITLLVFRGALFQQGIIQHGDLGFPLEIQEYLKYNISIWNPWKSAFDIHLPKLYLVAPLSALSFAGLPSEIVAKSYPAISLFFAGISMYFAVPLFWSIERNHVRTIVGSSVASLVYILNPFVMETVIHHFWFILGYGTFPLVLALYWRMLLRETSPHLSVYLALSLLLGISAAQPQTLIMNFLLISILFLLRLVFSTDLDTLRVTVKRTIILGLVFMFMNAFWLVPYALHGILAYSAPNYTLGVELLENHSGRATMLNVLQIRGDHLLSEFREFQKAINGSAWNLVIPISTLVAAWFAFRRRFTYAVAVAVVILIGVFLSLGTNSLLGSYGFLRIARLPFGWILRVPGRLQSFTVLGYATFIGFLVVGLSKSKGKLARVWLLISMVLIAVTIWQSYPMLTGTFGGHFLAMRAPKGDYNEAIAEAYSSDKNMTVMWQPFNLKYSWDPTGYSGKNIGALSTKNPVFGYEYSNNLLIWYLYYYELLNNRTSSIGKLVAPLSVQRIVWHRDIQNDLEEPRVNALRSAKDLELVEENSSLICFNNSQAMPRLAGLSSVYLFDGGLSAYSASLASGLEPSQVGIAFTAQFNKDNAFNSLSPFVTAYIADHGDTVDDLTMLFARHSVINALNDNTLHTDSRAAWANQTLTYGPWVNDMLAYSIRNWSFDYGLGLVSTSAPDAEVSVPIRIDANTDYDVLLRCIRHTNGGAVSVAIPGLDREWVIGTQSSADSWSWVHIGRFHSSGVEKVLFVLKNIRGFNAVNCFSIIPHSRFVEYAIEAKQWLKSRTQCYVLGINSGKEIGAGYDNVSSFDTLDRRHFEVWLSPKEEVAGEPCLAIDGLTPRPSNSGLSEPPGSDYKYVGAIELGPGTHEITLTESDPRSLNVGTDSEVASWMGELTGALGSAKGFLQSHNNTRIKAVFEKGLDLTSFASLWMQLREDASEEMFVKLVDATGRETNGYRIVTSTIMSIQQISLDSIDWQDCERTEITGILIDGIYPAYTLEIASAGFIPPDIVVTLVGSSPLRASRLGDAEVPPCLNCEQIVSPVSELKGQGRSVEEPVGRITSWRRVSTTQYEAKVHVEAKGLVLSLSEVYDPLWVLEVRTPSGPERYQPVQLYGAVNGFVVDTSGDYTVAIRYRPQHWVLCGTGISILGFAGFIIWGLKRWRNCLKR